MTKLSIIIPAYNEESTIEKLLDKVRVIEIPNVEKEIIVVDDCSTDKTFEILKKQKDLKVIRQEKNQGKGAAFKKGLKHSTGDIVIVQDADLEYNPEDIKLCAEPILKNQVKVVYGSRELNKKNKTHSSFIFFLGGRLVTLVTNILYGSHLTDEPTCYKCFDAELLKSIKINGNRFEWEPEITAKIIKKGIVIKEVPISYFPRKEGKKIKYRDGLRAIWTLIKYRF
ncbi:glycosyltransferase family 2 protein [Patescibacteria group bacterium]|nr:glycosyltransferase family 2 protein [Patescibacteria group bacterium]